MIMKAIGIYLVLATTHVLGLVDYTCPNTASSTAYTDFCERTLVDDMIMAPGSQNNIYAFKGDQVILRLPNASIAWGYPKPANALWPSIPSNIDAAFTFSVTTKTYFLKGSQFWRYTNYTLDEGFPKLISEGFVDVPDNVDAAVEWDKYIYFFKGKMNYRYDPCRNETFSIPLRDFVGLPTTRLNGVLKHPDGNVYFFIGDLYFTFSLTYMKVYPVTYPLQLGWNWFNCRWQ
ncbi:hypothetical protein B566_EDAN002433 [Ephemera danica]|nr:hypothetical protein B566_EDAN002433 [Ephemera danica]